MNRRSFLQAILAAGIAPAVVRAASLMPVRALASGLLVFHPDFFQLLTPEIITREALLMLERSLVLTGGVSYQFSQRFAEMGKTLTILKPERFYA